MGKHDSSLGKDPSTAMEDDDKIYQNYQEDKDNK